MDVFWSSAKQKTCHNSTRSKSRQTRDPLSTANPHKVKNRNTHSEVVFLHTYSRQKILWSFPRLVICKNWLPHKVWGSHARECKPCGSLECGAMYYCRKAIVILNSLLSPSLGYKDTSLDTSSLKIRAAVSSERLVSFY
jgi:hypothetical protein